MRGGGAGPQRPARPQRLSRLPSFHLGGWWEMRQFRQSRQLSVTWRPKEGHRHSSTMYCILSPGRAVAAHEAAHKHDRPLERQPLTQPQPPPDAPPPPAPCTLTGAPALLAPHANMSVTSVMRVSLGYWAVTSAVVPSIFDMMLWPPVLWPWGVRCFADDAVLKTTTVPSKGDSKMKSLLPPWRLATPPMPGCRPSSSPIHMGQPQHERVRRRTNG